MKSNMMCKPKNISKFLLLIFIVFTTVSCENDEDSTAAHQLIGTWLRTDVKEDFEFKLIFHPDNTGYKIVRSGTKETNIISSLIPFDWRMDNDKLSLIELDEAFLTSFSFNNEDQLVLKEYSDFPFSRVEE